ncbi:MFS transporter, partial [Enterococcus faecalis]
GVSTGTLQWVTTIYLLLISITVPLTNYLLKTYSLTRLFIVANLFFLIGLAIHVYSPSFSILLLGRLFHGASTGIGL